MDGSLVLEGSNMPSFREDMVRGMYLAWVSYITVFPFGNKSGFDLVLLCTKSTLSKTGMKEFLIIYNSPPF